MNATVEDLRATIIPKSDQLNAEQLLGGPMDITVSEVRVSDSGEQPVVVHYFGEGGRPFKPCKTMRKVLIHAWGPDGSKWVGRGMTLYNDAAVKFGGEDVGGIRISHMTDLQSDIKVSLTSTRGKKAKYEIKRLVSRIALKLTEIESAPDVDALKRSFGAAYKATKDEGERARLKSAYDSRLLDLSKPTLDVEMLMQRVSECEALDVLGMLGDDAAAIEDAATKATILAAIDARKLTLVGGGK